MDDDIEFIRKNPLDIDSFRSIFKVTEEKFIYVCHKEKDTVVGTLHYMKVTYPKTAKYISFKQFDWICEIPKKFPGISGKQLIKEKFIDDLDDFMKSFKEISFTDFLALKFINEKIKERKFEPILQEWIKKNIK